MLPKPNRLNLKTSFKWVSSGQRKQTSYFKIFYRFGENPKPLVGIALSKSSFKNAVERNRGRRLSSVAISQLYKALRNNLNLVMMPKANILESNPELLIKDLENVKEIFSTTN